MVKVIMKDKGVLGMKKTIIGLTLAATLMLAGCNNTEDTVIVKTDSGDLTQGEFYSQVKELAGTALLEQVVMNQILTSKYEASEEEVEEQLASYEEMYGDSFATLLESNGYTDESFRESLRFQILQQKAMEDQEVTDEEIEAYYEKGQYELHTRHIVAYSMEEAEEFLALINEGADFATIAKENSVDTTTAENGGDLEWLTVADMDTAFAEAAYALEVNEVSQVIETTLGYEIIQLVEKREVEDYASLEEQKEDIEATVLAQKVSTTEWETIEAELLKEANVVIKDKDLVGAFSDILNGE